MACAVYRLSMLVGETSNERILILFSRVCETEPTGVELFVRYDDVRDLLPPDALLESFPVVQRKVSLKMAVGRVARPIDPESHIARCAIRRVERTQQNP